MLQIQKDKEAQEVNEAYEKFKASGLTWEQEMIRSKKQRYAIELAEKERTDRMRIQRIKNHKSSKPTQLSCLHFSGKKYESFDKEQELGEIHYKRERENLY